MESTGTSVRSKLTMMLVLSICAGVAILVLHHLWGVMVAAGVFALLAIGLIMLTRNLIRTAADPIDRMNKTVTALTDGKIDITLRADAPREAGDVGVLENNLAKLAINQHNFMGDMDNLVKRAWAGEANLSLDAKNYPGGLRDLARQINDTLSGYEKVVTDVISTMDNFSRGSFTPVAASANPKVTEATQKLARQLQALKDDVGLLGQAAKDGRLNAKTSGSYTGEWLKIASDLNNILDAVNRPFTDILNALERMESCVFSASLSGHMQGDFEKIRSSFDKINALLSGHFSELSAVLNDISYGRTQSKLTRDYRGAFQPLQSAVNSVVRAYERVADDAKRTSGAPGMPVRPTALGAGTAARPAAPTPAPARTPFTPAATRPAPPRPAPARTAPAPSKPAGGGVNAPPLPVNSGRVHVPSGAHEYNRKDFGKYK
ncbi:MAG: hypothetical protein FWB88_06290 [Defluviitaleaceae bacterium]|nr:hypothetical protein [Defluviitaleaceae bacterium]MCL2240834.1 hypothetical protein [Defluviitaleaceae bacterium]